VIVRRGRIRAAAARQLYDGKAHTMAQIAAIVGVSRETLYRHWEPAEQAGPGAPRG
jgi:AcrR family transcriptional regulator